MAKSKALYFKSVKLSWWQAGLFKTSTVSLGIVLGVTFQDTLRDFLPFFLALFLICGGYIAYVWAKE